MAKKKSFRSAPRTVSGRESERCTLLIRRTSAMCFDPSVSVAREKPRQEIHGGDSHADTEENTRKHTLRASFAEGERESGDDNGDEREAAGDGAGERLLQNIDSVFPGRSSLGEGWTREEQSRNRGEDRSSGAPAKKDIPTFFHSHTSARKLHRQPRCEGSPEITQLRHLAAGTHWSKDTLGLPRNSSPVAS